MKKTTKPVTKKEMRIKIAQDVIKHLRAGKILARHGTYLAYSDVLDAPPIVTSRTGLDVYLRNCEVCAIGAALAAGVMRYNRVTVADVSFVGNLGYFNSDKVIEKATRFFSPGQLSLMEIAFEGETETHRTASYSKQTLHEERRAADAFYSLARYNLLPLTSGQHLAAIYKNVVRHEGKFVPKDCDGDIAWARKQDL